MPKINEIRQGKEIGYEGSLYHKYIWQACSLCGKERWVQVRKEGTKGKLCISCLCKTNAQKQRGIPRLNYMGANNPRWTGGRHKDNNGYVKIRLQPDNFFYAMVGKSGDIPEHRLVMAQFLGRCLQSWEVVHHKNGIRDDNRIENLEITAGLGEHIKDHNKGYLDGFQKGYYDGKNKQIRELKRRIKELEDENPKG